MIAVFTDLDGTLLDHETYSFAAARPAIDALAEHSIPLILASSKTEAEMAPIAMSLGIDTPMIVENGAGIARFESISDGNDSVYCRIRRMLSALPASLSGRFAGFGDWSISDVARETGLTAENARLAKMRRFSEPGHWIGTEEEKRIFIAHLNEHDFTAVQGGRFFTIMPRSSKADAMRRIANCLSESHGAPIFTVALGDAPNDLAMLQAADLGVIIANPHHDALPVTEQERNGTILRSSLAGPSGWNEAILTFLTRGRRNPSRN